MLRALFNTVTYRTTRTTPDPAVLEATPTRWGGRTVHHPHLPQLLEARRQRMVRDGADAADQALMDPATAALLRATAARITAEQTKGPPAEGAWWPVAA